MQNVGEQATRPQPEPLTRAELEPLWRRERQVSWLQIAAMAGLLLAGWLAQRNEAYMWVVQPMLVVALALLLAGAGLQMATRCPRCGSWLRGKILRMIPNKCPQCGVDFPREPS